MAHFAQLDENNVVINMIVVHNNELLDENGQESEEKGVQFCKNHYGQETIWIQCSYNNRIRKRFPSIGHFYSADLDAFIYPQPYPSWIFNEETCGWDAPVPNPKDGNPYLWDEETLSWQEITSV